MYLSNTTLFDGRDMYIIYYIENNMFRHLTMPKHVVVLCVVNSMHTGYTQKNDAVSKVNKKFISHLTRAQRTPSAAATVQVSYALPAVCFSCLLRGRGASFQDGVAAGKGFLCAPF